MLAAIEQAKKSLAEGGIPIGSVLVIDGEIVGRGHNQRVQKGSCVLHQRAVLYSTLSPCDMCSGTVLLYGIPKVVVGENHTFQGPEGYVKSRGVELSIQNNAECIQLMQDFIAAKPELWNEDIGE
jgi:cytosine deaminase